MGEVLGVTDERRHFMPTALAGSAIVVSQMYVHAQTVPHQANEHALHRGVVPGCVFILAYTFRRLR